MSDKENISLTLSLKYQELLKAANLEIWKYFGKKVLKFMFAGFENLFYLGWRGGVLLKTCEKVVPEIFLLKMM